MTSWDVRAVLRSDVRYTCLKWRKKATLVEEENLLVLWLPKLAFAKSTFDPIPDLFLPYTLLSHGLIWTNPKYSIQYQQKETLTFIDLRFTCTLLENYFAIFQIGEVLFSQIKWLPATCSAKSLQLIISLFNLGFILDSHIKSNLRQIFSLYVSMDLVHCSPCVQTTPPPPHPTEPVLYLVWFFMWTWQ